MNAWRRTFASLALLCSLAGCQSGPVLTTPAASTLVNGSIKVGMKRADVVARLGTPHETERSGTTEFLFYRTPLIMKAATPGWNPIAIVDGKVAGLGLVYYYKNRTAASN